MAIGPILREARQQKQLTASQVAEITRMKVQIVEDLENDDFHRIAATIYGKGFIKLFAETVDLDPDPLIADYMEQVGKPLPPKLPAPEPILANTTPDDIPEEQDEAPESQNDDLFSFADNSRKRTKRSIPSGDAPNAEPKPKAAKTDPRKRLHDTCANALLKIRQTALHTTEAIIQKMTQSGKSDKRIQHALMALGLLVLLLLLIPITRAILASNKPAALPDNEFILLVPPPEPYLE